MASIFANLQYSILLRFVLLCIVAALLSWSFQYLLISDTLYYNAFANQLSYERIKNMIDEGHHWIWLGNIFIPIIYGIKLTFITICLGLGYFFAKSRFNFSIFFNLAIFSELIFLLPILIKLLWFLFIKTDYDLNDLTLFYPLSLLNLVDAQTIPRYWLAPLQMLNLFEIAYWFLLAYGVADATGLSFKRSFGLVMSSYGVGLVLWVVLVMFLTITYS
ncbi:hypothetical protein GO730_29890 [Spirosoma sp. HMF3257]|uniref:Yip1 domain-containing protein n=1 Tax=Spirosoma telluris TaxID=2183553 RepID=A0A327NRP6_9BACT|nr:hypothetical protein [Spirosoma telluris]RAI77323.1 hypothetical protein HMF3257_29800 [Spirosoma telluris]